MKKNISKRVIFFTSIIGVGILGSIILKKKSERDNYYKTIDKDTLINELSIIFEANSAFTEEVLSIDAETLKTRTIDSIFNLNCIQTMQKMYYESRSFTTEELRDLAKYLYISKIKMLEGYLGRIDENEINKSNKRFINSIYKVEKIIKVKHLLFILQEHEIINEHIAKEYILMEDALEKNCSIANYINKYEQKIY